jgi:mono/diheme cytochrome c family protein
MTLMPSTQIRRLTTSALLIAGAQFINATAFPATAGDAEKRQAIAEKHCSRCHVVAKHNPMGGIGSTASFQMIAKMPDGSERFQTFFDRRPHPAFVRIPGVPRWSKQPGYATEITLTLDQVEDIAAFAKTLKTLPIRCKQK